MALLVQIIVREAILKGRERREASPHHWPRQWQPPVGRWPNIVLHGFNRSLRSFIFYFFLLRYSRAQMWGRKCVGASARAQVSYCRVLKASGAQQSAQKRPRSGRHGQCALSGEQQLQVFAALKQFPFATFSLKSQFRANTIVKLIVATSKSDAPCTRRLVAQASERRHADGVLQKNAYPCFPNVPPPPVVLEFKLHDGGGGGSRAGDEAGDVEEVEEEYSEGEE